MQGCFVVSDNIVSPLGLTTAENFGQLVKGMSGVTEHADTNISAQPFYAALFDKNASLIKDSNKDNYTKFEQL
jgi:3-oxoacyl-[acyl-carrier-protein] synthase-1